MPAPADSVWRESDTAVGTPSTSVGALRGRSVIAARAANVLLLTRSGKETVSPL